LLNYAENALRPPRANDPGGPPAVIAVSQTRERRDLSWEELTALVGAVRAGLLRAGVAKGDRVAAYLPNIPETLAAMLATANIGAVWACCAPETGVAGVLDRFSQIEPTVLICADGYRFGAKDVSRADQAAQIRAGLPSLRTAVWLRYLDHSGAAPAGWQEWDEFAADDGRPIEFEPVPFDHPLYVLFSSGTTGKPKPIVHGHGGITLEHLKALALHFDLRPGDRFFWFTTTGWMMWNFCVSGLLVGATVVMFDGDPASPSMDTLWDVMASTGTTCGGVGSGFLVACQKAGIQPGKSFDLTRLRTLGATGSPLPGSAARWVYEEVGGDVLVASFSGGTDVCTGFVGASPLHPVWPGEISCRCLGASVEVFADDGRSVVAEEGELVLTAPLPSMPVGFWGDPDGARYRAAYFERFPGVWAHGDRATLTDRGTVVITGRSDGTLNRGGVRIGTAELYEVVESDPGVADSLVVHLDDPGGGPGEIWLLVVPTDQATEALEDGLKQALRRDLSPRHVPDRVVRIPAVPRTLSGKKLEVPVKRILSGAEPEDALTLASLANPESIDAIVALAPSRTPGSP
ncbi:MAG TPA: acetoacetate--CoA ligase, partial [Acidimicrobiales bacterium]|nr:acetoacetate--CoA ligase [Acidimicrobiales bacterium]